MDAHTNSAAPVSVRHGVSSKHMDCLLYNIDRVSYTEALRLQHDFHSKCATCEIPAVLMLLEHDPVITMGVKASSTGNVLVGEQVLAEQGVELVHTDRGGDVTYHGPGQLVGYAILPLRSLGLDLHSYLRLLEQSIIDALETFGLRGERNGPAGVWVGAKKVCSIGIAVRKWVTYHGFALNVSPNMSHFGLINPCGLAATDVTSMTQLLGAAVDMAQVKRVCAQSFAGSFGLDLGPCSGELA